MSCCDVGAVLCYQTRECVQIVVSLVHFLLFSLVENDVNDSRTIILVGQWKVC